MANTENGGKASKWSRKMEEEKSLKLKNEKPRPHMPIYHVKPDICNCKLIRLEGKPKKWGWEVVISISTAFTKNQQHMRTF